MNAEDQNQDFEKLQHLLKLKRYEKPHPRYFNDFSSQVVSRIRAGRTGSRFEAVDNLISRTPWLRRLWRTVETQPALSGALAAVACGLMVAGVFLMETTTPTNLNFTAIGEPPGAENPGSDFATAPLGNNFAVSPQLVSSTNTAAVLTGPNLFDRMPGLPAIQPTPAAGLPLRPK